MGCNQTLWFKGGVYRLILMLLTACMALGTLGNRNQHYYLHDMLSWFSAQGFIANWSNESGITALLGVWLWIRSWQPSFSLDWHIHPLTWFVERTLCFIVFSISAWWWSARRRRLALLITQKPALMEAFFLLPSLWAAWLSSWLRRPISCPRTFLRHTGDVWMSYMMLYS